MVRGAIVILLCVAPVMAGCERPFVEESLPEINVVEPDLSEVQTEPVINLVVQASSFRPVRSVFLNGSPMSQSNQDSRYWALAIALRLGQNPLVLDATDIDGIVRTDTVFAVYMPFRMTLNAPQLPLERGGHATVRLRNGDILVTGGAESAGGLAQPHAFVLGFDTGRFITLQGQLINPRTGHTATLLPNGEVLIVGGSVRDNVTSVSDLVENVELFTPETRTFRELKVSGLPIRRTLHTAIVRNTGSEIYLDLLGGQGDTRYGDNPFLGIRQDLRSFRVEDDSLVAINTHASAPIIERPIYGHTTTRIQIGPYFALGNQFSGGYVTNSSIKIGYPEGRGVQIESGPAFQVPRYMHAAAPVLSELLVVFGGRQAGPADVLVEMEALSSQTEEFYKLPAHGVIRRYKHTATAVGIRSVLLIGGFNADGTANSASEYFNILDQ